MPTSAANSSPESESTPRVGRGLRAHVAGMATIAAALLWSSWRGATGGATADQLGLLTFWLVLSLASECFWLETPTRAGMVSMSLAVNLASLYALPWHSVLTIGAVSVFTADLLLHRRGGLRALFNAAQTVVSLGAAVGCLLLFAPGVRPGGEIFLRAPLAALAAPLVFMAVNTFAVAAVIALHRGQKLLTAWRENYGYGFHFLSSGVLLLIGITLVISVGAVGYISGLLYLVFFYFVRDTYHRRVREREERAGALAA